MIAVKLEGVTDLRAALDELSKGVKRKMAKGAVTAAALPSLRAMERHAQRSRDTGALIQSLGVRSILWKNGNATAVVGPRRGRFGPDGKDAPVWYAHLVEFGHTAANGKQVAGKPFMRPAWDETKGDGAAVMAEYLKPRIAAAAKRAAKKKARATT
jgi:HK97 gp10 family phage protein